MLFLISFIFLVITGSDPNLQKKYPKLTPFMKSPQTFKELCTTTQVFMHHVLCLFKTFRRSFLYRLGNGPIQIRQISSDPEPQH